jgi:hypothetical protein
MVGFPLVEAMHERSFSLNADIDKSCESSIQLAKLNTAMEFALTAGLTDPS